MSKKRQKERKSGHKTPENNCNLGYCRGGQKRQPTGKKKKGQAKKTKVDKKCKGGKADADTHIKRLTISPEMSDSASALPHLEFETSYKNPPQSNGKQLGIARGEQFLA